MMERQIDAQCHLHLLSALGIAQVRAQPTLPM